MILTVLGFDNSMRATVNHLHAGEFQEDIFPQSLIEVLFGKPIWREIHVSRPQYLDQSSCEDWPGAKTSQGFDSNQ